ncbi:MAG TPA: FtsX-like permease family protein [Steroidobacteraceae bacterium]|nr:FtsX-like permease family protein [Steroidobacteraceae bacterium]
MLWRASARHLLRHPAQLWLAVLGLALGVATVTAIDLASSSSQRALQLSVEAVNGRATHQIVGSPSGLDESLYTGLRTRDLEVDLAPVVEGYAQVSGQSVLILGVDVLADSRVREFSALPGGASLQSLRRWMNEPGMALASQPTAAALGLKAGASFRVDVAGIEREGRLYDTIDARPGLDNVLVVDIATAQEWFGAIGRLSRIDVRVADGKMGARELRALTARLPPGTQFTTSAQHSSELAGMTAAFTTNLQALSLLALLVSAFLIFNSVSFTVVQRRELLSTLRALGVTRGEVLTLIVIEAALLGVAGAALGAALGVELARALLVLISNTINDLYFVMSVRDVSVAPRSIAIAIALGCIVSVLAALAPAAEAAASPPNLGWRRSVLEARASRGTTLLALMSGVLLVAGSLLAFLPSRSLLAGFAAMLLLLLSVAFLAPALLRAAGTVSARLADRLSATLRLGLADAARSLSRTAIAVAALGVAISATLGIAIMVSSFRHSLDQWLTRTLRADVYVTAPGPGFARPERAIGHSALAQLLAVPGIAEHSAGRRVSVDSEYGPILLDALEPATHSFEAITLPSGNRADAWAAFTSGALLVSESFAYHHRVSVGDSLALQTPDGPRPFVVAGVYREYGSDRGTVLMHRAQYREIWHDEAVTSLGLYLVPGHSDHELIAALRSATADQQALLIRSNRELRALSLDIFERTFAITSVLYWLAAVVAAVGLFAALLAHGIERTRQTALLRALGLTPRGAAAFTCAQGLLLGIVAAVAAIPAGLLTAAVLVLVINRRAFGWHIDLHVSSGPIVNALLIGILAALLACIFPALRAARPQVAVALREE